MSSDAAQLTAQRTELLRYVGRQVRDSVLSEDIVQEAYLRLLTFEAKPDSAVSSVPALLRRISLNLIRDHFRRAARVPVVELADTAVCPMPTADQQLERRQLIEIVANILKTMPGLRREIFIRRRVHGQSAAEVGEALGVSPSAVSNHVARAILDLDAAIERLEKRGGPVRD
ncbi:RNA polymerase sigma factor [Sphingosinicella microcystinivorans]|uniref:DNA-directed RNA polymerase sigma-70 factor n=1 Tax=Sphingosinicella microcystinivorans TaxID=335406 RepID=A0AAD1D3S3_SPHMI|nr:RNA polymerase sigma factor [Sphingosinicella microcystinivorans]RKS85020.1 RNA polymerase sigma-70 factor (ECF subfamily) [Sphingosinicella microcystinivorans]BBE33322.1 DNA-directed RNA polymerase sigma-70 factor [Sphingosinicella microcystinivorans]